MDYETGIDCAWSDTAEIQSPLFYLSASPLSHPEESIDSLISTSFLEDLNAHSDDLSSTLGNEFPDTLSHNSTTYDISSPTSSIENYSLTTLDNVHNLVETITPSQQYPNQSCSPPELSVTSKLKSILMSRQQKQKLFSIDSRSSQTSTYSSGYRENNNNSSDSDIVSNTSHYNNRDRGPQSALKFPPCNVCGGNASGLHYGINTCEPCKGFFTRYLRKKEEYKCGKDGKCVTTNRLRGNCSACRLKKCLALGMSRKNSRLGRYSLTRRMETIKQVNMLEGKRESDITYPTINRTSSQRQSSASNITGILTGENSFKSTEISSPKTVKLKAPNGFSGKLVKSLVDYMEKIKPYGEELVTHEQIVKKLHDHYEEYTIKIKLFGELKSIPREEYFSLLKGFGIEIDRRMMYLKQSANVMLDVIERYCNFAKQIPDFKSLSKRDQSNLLKSSRYDFFMILMHEGYLHDEQVFLAHDGFAFHREEVADKFFSRKLVFTVCEMYHRLQKLKLSKDEKALLIAVCLVFTDRCSLDNPALVEQIQFSITHLLRNQLEKTCKQSASRRFTKIIDCLVVMRETSELFLQEYNQLCNDENVIEEVPIMTELLFEDS